MDWLAIGFTCGGLYLMPDEKCRLQAWVFLALGSACWLTWCYLTGQELSLFVVNGIVGTMNARGVWREAGAEAAKVFAKRC